MRTVAMPSVIRLIHGRSARLAVVLVATTALLGACQPGWTGPFVGTGNGTGTVPGATNPPNAQVSLQNPRGVVAIPGGGFYVWDEAACAIYKVANDTTSVYAGTPGTCGDSGDNGPATAARLNGREGITSSELAVDAHGTLYFAQGTFGDGPPYGRVRSIASNGTIASVDGTQFAMAVTASPNGVVFVNDSHELLRINADGSTTSVVSVGSVHPGLYSNFVRLLAKSDDELIVTVADFDGRNGPVYSIDVSTGTATDTGVTDSTASVGDASPVAMAPDGTEYITNTSYQVVRIDTDGTKTIIAGTGTTTSAEAQYGLGTDLNLNPSGLAVTPNHGLLISSGHVVYRLDHPELAGETPAAS